MKVAVFVSAGLGDALLLVPLVKKLKQKGALVTGIFTSSFKCEQLFFDTTIFDEIIVSPEGLGPAIFSSINNFRKFDVAYLNFFAATKKNLLLAGNISKKIITSNPKIQKIFSPISDIEIVEPLKGIHDATQNIRLSDPTATDAVLNGDLIRVNFPNQKLNEKKFPELTFLKKKKYFAVQISTGNNIQQYKNWRAEHWCKFLKSASETFPEHFFLLLGDPNEKEIAEIILKQNILRICSVAGKTEIPEVIQLICNSEMFIGLDGGLMHIAAAAGKPTFTLWGASDFNLYGYEKINPSLHKITFREISCRPCNSWINPNVTRVKNPMECPDLNCMQNLSPGFVFSEFQIFYKKIFPA